MEHIKHTRTDRVLTNAFYRLQKLIEIKKIRNLLYYRTIPLCLSIVKTSINTGLCPNSITATYTETFPRGVMAGIWAFSCSKATSSTMLRVVIRDAENVNLDSCSQIAPISLRCHCVVTTLSHVA